MKNGFSSFYSSISIDCWDRRLNCLFGLRWASIERKEEQKDGFVIVVTPIF